MLSLNLFAIILLKILREPENKTKLEFGVFSKTHTWPSPVPKTMLLFYQTYCFYSLK